MSTLTSQTSDMAKHRSHGLLETGAWGWWGYCWSGKVLTSIIQINPTEYRFRELHGGVMGG